jgi:hypothetical protein
VECEVVVVDDKSADNSTGIISRFLDPSGVWAGKACSECKHPPPKYTLIQHTVNQGAGVTRNDGVAAARGQVILFGEADDVFYEHHAAVCWDMMRRHPNLGFIKMRMDAGKEYVESSFIAYQAPVQVLHPHWQVAIEDTSPMNLCIRRDAHRFIGGFPDGELFHMDMEDGAYMMCLYEAYAGAKWLSSPSTLYVRRVDNGLDRRMAQFTNAPGSVPLGEQDARYGEQRMDLIDGGLAGVRDRLAEYQSFEELLALDPLCPEALELHRQRGKEFGHAYGLARPAYTSSSPPPVLLQGQAPHAEGSRVAGTPSSVVREAGGEERGMEGLGVVEARRYSAQEAHMVALLFRGCRPRALRNLMASLLYRLLANPLRFLLLLDRPYPSGDGGARRAGGTGSTCGDMEEIGQMFPVHVRAFEGQLVVASLVERAAIAVVSAIDISGGHGSLSPARDIVLLFELASEVRLPSRAPLGGDRGRSGGTDGPRGEEEAVAVDYCRLMSVGLTTESLANAQGRIQLLERAGQCSRDTSKTSAQDPSPHPHPRAHAEGKEEPEPVAVGLPAEYEHFWGVEWVSSPLAAADDEQIRLHHQRQVATDQGVVHGDGEDRREEAAHQGAWGRFKVLPSRSVSAARVCGEVLRDKSGSGGWGEEGEGKQGGGRELGRASGIGCCVVRVMGTP